MACYLTDVTHRTIGFEHCSPDGAACGVIRENLATTRIAPQAAPSGLRLTQLRNISYLSQAFAQPACYRPWPGFRHPCRNDGFSGLAGLVYNDETRSFTAIKLSVPSKADFTLNTS